MVALDHAVGTSLAAAGNRSLKGNDESKVFKVASRDARYTFTTTTVPQGSLLDFYSKISDSLLLTLFPASVFLFHEKVKSNNNIIPILMNLIMMYFQSFNHFTAQVYLDP